MSAEKMISDLQQQIAEAGSERFIPVGGRSKNALACDQSTGSMKRVPMTEWTGILTYDPSEYLLTARAGTTLAEIQAALSEHGQYLPFDPLFLDQGATVGGTVAAGISGPGRLLHGGIRDFVMEVELIDGMGALVRGGGKVVKNTAGFDLPKLMVGSYGRLGILTEVTMKVLPKPAASVTVVAKFQTFSECVRVIQKVLAQPLPVQSLELLPDKQLLARFAGPSDCLENVVKRASVVLGSNGEVNNLPATSPASAVSSLGELPSCTKDDATQVTAFGTDNDASNGHQHDYLETEGNSLLLRVTFNPEEIQSLITAGEGVDGIRLNRISCAATVAWYRAASVSVAKEFGELIAETHCAGICICGDIDEMLLVGKQDWLAAARMIQSAMDPKQQFAAF